MTEQTRQPLVLEAPRPRPSTTNRRRRGHKNLCGALMLAAALIGTVPPVASARSDRPIGSTLRQERLRDALRRHVLQGLDGETLSLSSLQGEVVVINFWASWCRPCRRELPVLDRSGEIAFTTSDTDGEGLSELGSVTRRLLAAKPSEAPEATAAEETQ